MHNIASENALLLLVHTKSSVLEQKTSFRQVTQWLVRILRLPDTRRQTVCLFLRQDTLDDVVRKIFMSMQDCDGQ